MCCAAQWWTRNRRPGTRQDHPGVNEGNTNQIPNTKKNYCLYLSVYLFIYVYGFGNGNGFACVWFGFNASSCPPPPPRSPPGPPFQGRGLRSSSSPCRRLHWLRLCWTCWLLWPKVPSVRLVTSFLHSLVFFPTGSKFLIWASQEKVRTLLLFLFLLPGIRQAGSLLQGLGELLHLDLHRLLRLQPRVGGVGVGVGGVGVGDVVGVVVGGGWCWCCCC